MWSYSYMVSPMSQALVCVSKTHHPFRLRSSSSPARRTLFVAFLGKAPRSAPEIPEPPGRLEQLLQLGNDGGKIRDFHKVLRFPRVGLKVVELGRGGRSPTPYSTSAPSARCGPASLRGPPT